MDCFADRASTFLKFFVFLAIVSITACSSSGGDDDNDEILPLLSIPGTEFAMAKSVIEDIDITVEVQDVEFSTDLDGNQIQRTSLKIVFHEDTTVGEINNLLAEFSAEILAALEGYPALVVRIPDPGTLPDLETLIADIESRSIVAYVLKSIVLETLALPANLQASLSTGGDPLSVSEIKDLNDHNLAIRAPGAWNFNELITGKPITIVADKFGDGPRSSSFFDIEKIPGFSSLGFKTNKNSSEHGYKVLALMAARHSNGTQLQAQDFTTGIVPDGIATSIIDISSKQNSTMPLLITRLMQRLKKAIQSTSETIIVNLSLGYENCKSTQTFEDPCWPLSAINDDVVDFIKMMRHINAHQRALLVSAAGNKKSNNSGGFLLDSMDGETSSPWNAASIMTANWNDPASGTPISSLDNILIVENARNQDTAPFSPDCVDSSSFINGHIAGIGADIKFISSSGSTVTSNGTSFAAPQVAGVAAYIAALRPDLSPQDLIYLLTETADILSGSSIDCELDSNVDIIDAYAALLATDPPGSLDPVSAIGRLTLLDITDSTDTDFQTDGSFNIYDLRKWIAKLTSQSLFEEEKYYSRYDLNGDGIAGGGGFADFDLDVSFGIASNTLYTEVGSSFDGIDISYDETAVSDFEILCYYANSPLFEITEGQSPFTPEDRDLALLDIAEYCDPCSAFASRGLSGTSSRGICQESQRLVFSSFSDGNGEIYTINSDGTNQLRLTDNTTDDEFPDWSPNGSKIVFVSRRNNNVRNIFTMDPDGTNVTPVTDNQSFDSNPDWSPDGGRIVFDSFRNDQEDIFVIDADGTNEQVLTDGTTISASDPAWSPDGSKIVFTGIADSNQEIFVMDADGTNVQRLTTNPGSDVFPSWSPDSASIVFSSKRTNESSSRFIEIYIMDADGSNQRPLTNIESASISAAWSSDGSTIAFQAIPGDIYLMDPDGSNIRLLSSNPQNRGTPSWSP